MSAVDDARGLTPGSTWVGWALRRQLDPMGMNEAGKGSAPSNVTPPQKRQHGLRSHGRPAKAVGAMAVSCDALARGVVVH